MIEIRHREAQHSVALFGGRLHENKPLAGKPLYSNLIYWAHVEALEEGTFPMHPHEGIEILTFIFEGGLEHYDTATSKWTPLPGGGVQHIVSGRGLQHSEKYFKGSRAFQIWFDPNFSKALNANPYYHDYQAHAFNWTRENGFEVMTYAGENGPIKPEAPGISAKRYKVGTGVHNFPLDKSSVYSIYLMDGRGHLDKELMKKDSFAKVESMETVSFETDQSCELFILTSPAHVPYTRVADR